MNGERQFSFRRLLFFLLGLICLALSYIGILLPGVPAIPFILLSVYFLVGSSPRLYAWMLRRKVMAKILDKIQKNRGKTGFSLFVISQLWVSVVVADLLFVDHFYPLLALYISGVIISVVVFYLLRKGV